MSLFRWFCSSSFVRSGGFVRCFDCFTGFVSVLRRFRLFRSGGFVSVIRVLVHAVNLRK